MEVGQKKGNSRICANLDHKNAQTYSPLCVAALGGHLHVVKYLHKQGASPNPALLWAAILSGNYEMVVTVFGYSGSKYPAENRTNAGRCVLLAAQLGHLEILKFLHQHYYQAGNTLALIQAAKGGHLEVARSLVQDMMVAVNATDAEGRTALHFCTSPPLFQLLVHELIWQAWMEGRLSSCTVLTTESHAFQS